MTMKLLANALLSGLFACIFTAGAQDFDWEYSDVACPPDGLPDKLRYFLYDDATFDYVAPCIASGENDFSKYFHRHIFQTCAGDCDTLCQAAEKPKPERVIVRFTITAEGETANAAVLKGVNPLYDNEAMRLVRELHFSNPATLHGQTVALCVTCPVLFDTRLFCPK